MIPHIEELAIKILAIPVARVCQDSINYTDIVNSVSIRNILGKSTRPLEELRQKQARLPKNSISKYILTPDRSLCKYIDKEFQL